VDASGLTFDELNPGETVAVTKPFDSTLKELEERKPRPWLSLWLGRPIPAVQVINSDLSTITAEADKLFRVEGPRPWIIHNEFEASYKVDAPLKGLRYSVLARYRHGLPVQTIFILLRPEADGPAMSGKLEEELPDGTKYLLFEYTVVRVWELPVEQILAGDLVTLPLAPIARVSAEDLPGVVRRMDERIEQEATPSEAQVLRTAALILTGLRHPQETLKALFQGVRGMKESSAYQMILEEGREEGMIRGTRQTLLRQGRKRFGPPSPDVEAKLEAILALDQLQKVADRILDVSSWEELMSDS
jgi:predicted transposase YdaD